MSASEDVELRFSLNFITDPIGADLTATVPSGSNDDARRALLDDVERKLVGERDNLIFGFIETVNRNLREYASRHGYDTESTIESVQQPDVNRSQNSLQITVVWESPQMTRWEFGTSDHTIDGDPVLSFIWEDNDKRGQDPPQWVREEFDRARGAGGMFQSGWRVFLPEVDVRGLPESRAVRDAINALRRVIES